MGDCMAFYRLEEMFVRTGCWYDCTPTTLRRPFTQRGGLCLTPPESRHKVGTQAEGGGLLWRRFLELLQ